jgi:predicted nucleic acid-binding protein
MPAEPLPYSGAKLIADSSAWTAIRRSKQLKNTPPEWFDAMVRGQLLISPIVRLELLHSSRTKEEFAELDNLLEYFAEIPVSKAAFSTAERAIRELARRGASGGFHRVGVSDALIAASAYERQVGVLHYNHDHFGKLRMVLDFNNVELAPPGTFERN